MGMFHGEGSFLTRSRMGCEIFSDLCLTGDTFAAQCPAVRILKAVRINEFAILLEESSAVANVFHTKTGSDVWRYGRIRRIESAEMKKVDKGRR